MRCGCCGTEVMHASAISRDGLGAIPGSDGWEWTDGVTALCGACEERLLNAHRLKIWRNENGNRNEI